MTERMDAHNLAVADADEEIHKQVCKNAILARATQVHVNQHVTNWVTAQQGIQYLRLQLSGSLTGKCRI